MGTISTMASGSFQLSYCAASTRKTNTAEAAKIDERRDALLLLLMGELGPFEGEAGRQHLLGKSSPCAPWPCPMRRRARRRP